MAVTKSSLEHSLTHLTRGFSVAANDGSRAPDAGIHGNSIPSRPRDTFFSNV